VDLGVGQRDPDILEGPFFISCCDQHRIWLIYAEARHSEFP
jgi:hypothetical protein